MDAGTKDTKKKDRKTKPKHKGKRAKNKHITHRHAKRTLMEIAYQASAALAIIGGIVITILQYYHKQTPTVWVTFVTVIFIALGFCCFWQDKIWKAEVEAKTRTTTLSRMTNKELRAASEKLISELRLFTSQREQQDRIRSDRHRQQMIDAKSDEERKRIWAAQTSETLTGISLNSEYEEKFEATTILLRDELLLRLPENSTDPGLLILYKHPTNTMVLRELIQHLERLSKSLPA